MRSRSPACFLASLLLFGLESLPSVQAQTCPPASCPPGSATTSTATFSASTGLLEPPQGPAMLQLPRFAAGPGQTLVLAELTLRAAVVGGSVKVQNLGPSPVQVATTLAAQVQVTAAFPPLAGGVAFGGLQVGFIDMLGPWTGGTPCTFGGPDSAQHTGLGVEETQRFCITDPVTLATQFLAGGGAGSVDLGWTSVDASSFSGPGNVCVQFAHPTLLEASVVYTYCQNAPPIANDDAASVCRLASVDIPVLVNDVDPGGGALDCSSLAILSPPAHGTATPLAGCASGSPCPGVCVRYTSTDPGFTGVDTFVYRIGDNGGATDTAIVSVLVCGVTANPDVAQVCSGGVVDIPVLANDTTTCGTLNCASLTFTQPPAGQGTVFAVSCPAGGPCPGSCLRFTPAPGFTGPVTFSYTIANTTAPACFATATVTVTSCGVVTGPDAVTVCAGGTVDIPVTQNDVVAPSCGALNCASLAIASGPGQGTATVLQSCSGAGGACPSSCIRYTAPAGFSGLTTFSYTISNNQVPACTATGVVTVLVCRVLAVADTATVCAGGTVEIQVLENDAVAGNCGMLKCSSLTVSVPPAQGTAVVQQNCSFTGGICPTTCIRYTAPADFSGPVTFNYSVTNNGTPACTGTATVTVDVCRVIANPDAAFVCSGGVVDIPVLANDTTTCGTLNCASLAFTQPPAGQGFVQPVTCAGAGSCPGVCLRFAAAPSFSGPVSFTYTIGNTSSPPCFATTTVTIDVCRVDALDDTALVCGPFVDIPVTANDSATCGGIDCNSLVIVAPPLQGTAQVLPGCKIRYTPDITFTGPDSLVYRVGSGSFPGCFDTAQVTLQRNGPQTCPPGNTSGSVSFTDCYGCTLPSGIPPWVSGGPVPRLSLPKFRPRPGQLLREVSLRTRVTTSASAQAENTSPVSPCGMTLAVDLQAQVCPTLPIPGSCSEYGAGGCFTASASQVFTDNLAPFDGAVDFQGPSGVTHAVNQPTEVRTELLSVPAALSFFVDSNPEDGIDELVQFDHAAQAQILHQGCGNAAILLQAHMRLEVEVIYTYCSVGTILCEPGVNGTIACPCANPPSGPARGCNNFANTGGGRVVSNGGPSLAADTVLLHATLLVPGATVTCWQGSVQLGNPAPYARGVLCVGGALLRMYTGLAPGGAARFPTPGSIAVSQRSSQLGDFIQPGQSRYYFVLYRDPAIGGCGPTAALNLTNAVLLPWLP